MGRNHLSAHRRLWLGLGLLLLVSFSVLLWMGGEIYRKAPPLPSQVLAEDGAVLYTAADIQRGRQVWQSMGGMQLGSIWGHGGYVAPDWSADWLHKEAMAVLDRWAQREFSAEDYASLPVEQQSALRGRLEPRMRRNTYDAATNSITLEADRAAAIHTVAAHYESLFGSDPATAALREAYAMKNDTVPDAQNRHALTAFFWWTAWAAATNRPGAEITYTNNWPGEPLIGNRPPASTYLWSAFSVLFLIAGIALLGWHHAVTHGRSEESHQMPASDPLAMVRVSPSMKATAKYFWVVLALFLVQILLGAMTAHYEVEGQELYGFQLADVLPYSLTRTWHTQLAVLWIATAWLGTGLYIAPAISGHEPKWQRLGVNFLWVCLLVIVVGSFAGQWLAVMQKLGLENNFWFGHQGWEYADLGRFWQWFLFVGLILWLLLVGRGLWPALKRGSDSRSIVALLAVLFATIVFMAGGVLGTLHHLYFAGTPTAVLALGASFSALEVVPLAYIGFEAYHTYKLGRATPWMQRYRWPIRFFVAVAFWNLVGAGLFGFLINPPLSLYYMQGLNLTPLHGHTALFGVYGMLGIGLVLFFLRGLKPGIVWNERLLRTCFWSLNIGLALMAALTLLPIGTLQLLAAIDHGYWYARSEEFMQAPIVELLVWMRMPGDIIFSIGAVAFTWFVIRLWIMPRRDASFVPGTRSSEV